MIGKKKRAKSSWGGGSWAGSFGSTSGSHGGSFGSWGFGQRGGSGRGHRRGGGGRGGGGDGDGGADEESGSFALPVRRSFGATDAVDAAVSVALVAGAPSPTATADEGGAAHDAALVDAVWSNGKPRTKTRDDRRYTDLR